MHRISDRIHFTETSDKFTLEISNGVPVIVKYIFIILTPCVLIGVFFVFASIISLDELAINFLKILGGFLSLIAGILWLNKTIKKEIVEVTKTTLSIRLKSLLRNRIKTYLISDIAYFKCVVENAFTKNSLHVGSFDYIGVQTGERQLQEVIKDGTLEFFYQGARVRFGIDILSWEAEEIIFRIGKFTGNNLQLDDSMEKLLDDLKDVDNQVDN